MIKRTITETIREYGADGRVLRETVTEAVEDDDTVYFPYNTPLPNTTPCEHAWWMNPTCVGNEQTMS